MLTVISSLNLAIPRRCELCACLLQLSTSEGLCHCQPDSVGKGIPLPLQLPLSSGGYRRMNILAGSSDSKAEIGPPGGPRRRYRVVLRIGGGREPCECRRDQRGQIRTRGMDAMGGTATPSIGAMTSLFSWVRISPWSCSSSPCRRPPAPRPSR